MFIISNACKNKFYKLWYIDRSTINNSYSYGKLVESCLFYYKRSALYLVHINYHVDRYVFWDTNSGLVLITLVTCSGWFNEYKTSFNLFERICQRRGTQSGDVTNNDIVVPDGMNLSIYYSYMRTHEELCGGYTREQPRVGQKKTGQF